MATIITFRQNCSKVQFSLFSLRKKCWFSRRCWDPTTLSPSSLSLEKMSRPHHLVPFITSSYLTLMLSEEFSSRMFTLVPSASTKYQVKILALVLSLCAFSNSIRDRTWLYHAAILPASKAPWNHLFVHSNHSSFLLMTGLNCKAFDMLHNIL